MSAYPGKLLGSASDYQHGPGTYVYLNQIHASTKGYVQIEHQKGESNQRAKISVVASLSPASTEDTLKS